MTEARVTTLAGGLRVVSADMPGLETAAVGAWVNAGARCEPVELNGVSHLLEHMAFKGTRRRSALAIAEEIESVGGHLNAYTSREQTAYIARVMKADIPLAVDLLADILQHTTMPDDELAREREVVMYRVGPGDTLIGVARQFAIDIDDLATDNGLDSQDKLREGALLKLMVKSEVLSRWKKKAGRAEKAVRRKTRGKQTG